MSIYLERARRDAVERWDVGSWDERRTVTSVGKVYESLVEQNAIHDWGESVEQMAADAIVIWEHIEQERTAQANV